ADEEEGRPAGVCPGDELFGRLVVVDVEDFVGNASLAEVGLDAAAVGAVPFHIEEDGRRRPRRRGDGRLPFPRWGGGARRAERIAGKLVGMMGGTAGQAHWQEARARLRGEGLLELFANARPNGHAATMNAAAWRVKRQRVLERPSGKDLLDPQTAF